MGSLDRYVSHEFWFDHHRWGLVAEGAARDESTDPDDPGGGGEFDGLVLRCGPRLQVMAAAESGHVRVDWCAFESPDSLPDSEAASSTVMVPTPQNELRIYDHFGNTQGTLLTSSSDSLVRVEVMGTHDWGAGEGVAWGAAQEVYRVSVAPVTGPARWTTRNPTDAMLYWLADYAPSMGLPRPSDWERPDWEDHDVDDLGPLAEIQFRQVMRWIGRHVQDRGRIPAQLLPHLRPVLQMWEQERLDRELLHGAELEIRSYLTSIEHDHSLFDGLEGRTARAALCLVDPSPDNVDDRMAWVQSMLPYA
ncbi:hypothetical protein ACFUC1_18575 [Pedococcus sp. NPDC057267]|uniref:hypothetical protein n=1 Tax=Pedococcus sp. NPDC057267 TaxID=3346077 RepID=UPI00363071B4